MNKKIILTASIVAGVIVAAVVVFYVAAFGPVLSGSHEVWGQFGDYFGGLLNPVFAMLAFLALLWSIAMQTAEFEKASRHLSVQTDLARLELKSARDDRLSQELLHVIKDIDARLESILQTVVSPEGGRPRLTIAHMAAEAERLAGVSDVSGSSYGKFLEQARTPGSVVEASTRELIHLVDKMREIIEKYSLSRVGGYAPVIEYYADKVFHILHLVHDVGGAKGDAFNFFAKAADPDD